MPLLQGKVGKFSCLVLPFGRILELSLPSRRLGMVQASPQLKTGIMR